MSAPMAVPKRLTIATCIGCGAMSLPSGCPGGCGPERKLELVAGTDVDLLLESAERSRRRGQRLAAVLQSFLADALTPADRSPGGPAAPDVDTGAATGELERGHDALRTHERALPATVRELAAAPDPVVTWWCERCGGLEAPAPCVGVCIRQPAEWATLEAWQEAHTAAADTQEVERQLARAVRAMQLTRPRPGRERQHRRALRTTARRALRLWEAAGGEAPSLRALAEGASADRHSTTMGAANRAARLEVISPGKD